MDPELRVGGAGGGEADPHPHQVPVALAAVLAHQVAAAAEEVSSSGPRAGAGLQSAAGPPRPRLLQGELRLRGVPRPRPGAVQEHLPGESSTRHPRPLVSQTSPGRARPSSQRCKWQ